MMRQLVIPLKEGLHCILPNQIVDNDGVDLDFGTFVNLGNEQLDCMEGNGANLDLTWIMCRDGCFCYN